MPLEPPKLKKSFINGLESIVGPKNYSVNRVDRLSYARDSNFKAAIQARYGKTEYPPDLIAWPENVPQVKALVSLALRHKMPIVPYGGGSGVCGGTTPVFGGMIIDVKKMRRLVSVDAENLLATAEAGMMGWHLENELQRKGFTMGHFPSSIVCASLGGYLAARSAGQCSSRYGKIEDMVKGVQFVTGTAEIVQTHDTSNSSGLDLNQILLGSEGTLGLFTGATFRIWPKPPATFYRGVRFRNMQAGLEAMRRFMQAGLRPSVVRLYDPFDTMLFLSHGKGKGKGDGADAFPYPFKSSFAALKDLVHSQSIRALLSAPKLLEGASRLLSTSSLLIFGTEGIERLALEEQKQILKICKDLGAEDLGEEPGLYWNRHRYSVSYKASPLFYSGAFTDTIEVATTWDKIYRLYHEMKSAMSSKALVLAHISHVYTEGASIYFTFVAPLGGLSRSEHLYEVIWERAMKACQKVGGIISHHHGVGRLKAKYMAEEWGNGLSVYRRLKEYFDPYGIMNPGKLVTLKDLKGAKAA